MNLGLWKTLICDRIVCGVSSDALQKQLLKERDLTLHKAVKLYQVHESAERYDREVSDQQEVNAVRQQASSATVRDKACMYWGCCHALQKELCPAFGKKYSLCMKMHHFARVCRSTEMPDDADIHVIIKTETQIEIHYMARVNTNKIRQNE